MTSGSNLFLRMRLWAVLLLAAIGMQAAEPIRAPLERVPGSAFSAATLDVALVTTRKSEAAATQELPTPPVTRSVPAAALRPLAIAVAESRLRLLPEARGPPPRQHPARLPDLRGPPAA
ncbi:hypothetical protein [Novosphingobium pentaromativorans]|uniref:Uncharacterized protein n=1 Tax=Novosphingobium pentaromativorans US6-1 TaxID=1088721 RepID=G6EDR6_9SPHN|nr:hypothetical protein [Novosphingobium pentaromativorans]AIT79665.1 hypothetical protein JI59_07645 [Novosphingobium pentaromativorans US6-1]EHJ60554.1 hypothetical protein NSU_2487 [Novosphingobium pentaromativorans US6-1]